MSSIDCFLLPIHLSVPLTISFSYVFPYSDIILSERNILESYIVQLLIVFVIYTFRFSTTSTFLIHAPLLNLTSKASCERLFVLISKCHPKLFRVSLYFFHTVSLTSLSRTATPSS